MGENNISKDNANIISLQITTTRSSWSYICGLQELSRHNQIKPVTLDHDALSPAFMTMMMTMIKRQGDTQRGCASNRPIF